MGVYQLRWGITSAGTGGQGYSTFHWLSENDSDLDITTGVNETHAFFSAIATGIVQGMIFTPPSEAIRVDVSPEVFVPITHANEPVEGIQSFDALPWATQACVSWKSAVRARYAQGRNFIPGYSENESTDGIMSAAAHGDLQAAAAGLVSTVSTAGLCIWSRSRLVSNIVTSSSVNRDWAVLRSRRD